MARRRMDRYLKGPKAEEAKVLAKKVFTLRENLGLSHDQMAEETGLTKAALFTLKCAWVNGKKSHKYMYTSVANGLIKFWNCHLINGEKIVKVKSAKSPSPAKTPEPKDVLDILIQRVGLAKARELLQARGKEDKLEKFLCDLTPEKLADLI
ncbi:MAG: hypothetical protein NTX00_03130 [Candidatus Parcubacteria bacterium]|nr:hypothetical protein [Candidatus Parcubacteria bacterium]